VTGEYADAELEAALGALVIAYADLIYSIRSATQLMVSSPMVDVSSLMLDEDVRVLLSGLADGALISAFGAICARHVGGDREAKREVRKFETRAKGLAEVRNRYLHSIYTQDSPMKDARRTGLEKAARGGEWRSEALDVSQVRGAANEMTVLGEDLYMFVATLVFGTLAGADR